MDEATTAVTPSGQRGRTFVQRLAGAAVLRVATYEDVEADPRATRQAIAVVVLAGVAAAIGSSGLAALAPAQLLVAGAAAVVAWVVWAIITCQLGVHVFPESRTRADVGELLRTVGFSAAPGMLLILGVLPGLTIPVFALTGVWMLLTMIVAVRQALDYSSTGRAVIVCVAGWSLSIGLLLAFGFFFGPRLA